MLAVFDDFINSVKGLHAEGKSSSCQLKKILAKEKMRNGQTNA